MQKPSKLPNIRSLPTDLEVLPAILLVLLWEGSIAEPVLFVVDIEQVLDNGTALGSTLSAQSAIGFVKAQCTRTYLPQLHPSIRILESRHAPVWRNTHERLFRAYVRVRTVERAHFEWQVEFVEEDDDFPRVRRHCSLVVALVVLRRSELID